MRITTGDTYKKKRAAKKCVSYGCPRDGGSKGKARFCYKHKRDYQRETNPHRYYLDHLKQNAQRRGIKCDLTLYQFTIFCEKGNYLELKSKSRGDFTIDRINPNKGYTEGNLQMLSRANNTRKMWVDLKIRLGSYPTKEELIELYEGRTLEELLAYMEIIETESNSDEVLDKLPF